MREFVGVKSWLQCYSESSMPAGQLQPFKRDALIFHKLAIPYFKKYLIKLFRQGATEHSKYLAVEYEWLLEHGVVLEPPDVITDDTINNDEEIQRYKKLGISECSTIPRPIELVDPDPLFAAIEAKESHSEIIKKLEEGFSPLFNLLKVTMIGAEYEVRKMSLILRKLKNMDAYPIAPVTAYLSQSSDVSKSDVVQIAINSLPTPDESISWEQIIEYRNDPDSQSKFLALRHWMSEVARAELTPAEVEEKLEYLLDQYQRHLKLHRMKTNVGTLETVITTGAEVLGDLVSFKWGKAAEAMFSLRRRKVALLEGELTAPGNEVAYIVKARETFESR